MATDNLEEIVKQLSNLKVVDLAKLKKMLEEEWDVSAAAPTAVALAAAPTEAAAPAEESTEFQVTFTEAPPEKKISLIKAVREICGVNLREAKEVVENVPKVLKENAPKAEAEEIAKKIEAAGGKATLKGV